MSFRVALLAVCGAALASCGPLPRCPEVQIFQWEPGTYRTTSSMFEPDWQIVLSADRATATETFTRDGKKYVVTYAVTEENH